MRTRIFAALALMMLGACANEDVNTTTTIPDQEDPEVVYDCIQESNVTKSEKTSVTITIPTQKIAIDPMIYGQMLEDCNDKVIYGGIVSNEGKENTAVTEMLRPLNIPVMRWPAGTAIYDYEWWKGIGKERKAEREYIWGGWEYYTFGTDEFITWCERLDIEPYINIPMGNNTTYDHSLERALEWLDSSRTLRDSEMEGAKTSLRWAARTYLVAALSAIATLLYYVAMINNRRD